MSGFEDYPAFLQHPEKVGKIAHSAAEEEALVAAGYQRPGKSNPAAFIEAQNNPEPLPAHEEYPRFENGKVVNDPSAPPPKREGEYPKYLGGKIMTEEEEISMLIEADEEARIPAHERAEERDRLLKTAEDRGIRVDGRWGIDRLRHAVGEGEHSSPPH